MIEIVLVTFVVILALFFIGFGITSLVIPEKLKFGSFWFIPWIAIIYLSLTLVFLSLLGLPIRYAAILVLLIVLTVNIFVVIKKYDLSKFTLPQDLIILLFVVVSIFFSLYPLIKAEGFLTTISLGNNDPINYANVGEFLIDQTVFGAKDPKEFLMKPVGIAIRDLLDYSYRWGTPAMPAFFSFIFQLEVFKLLYVLPVILFSFTAPLVYILLRSLYKATINGLILVVFLAAFNVNLLYILYHGFLAQLFFGGVATFVVILAFNYFSSESQSKTLPKFSRYDFLLGAGIAALFTLYHEGIIFVVVPMVIFGFLKLLLKKEWWWLVLLLRIGLVSTVLASVPLVINALRFDLAASLLVYGPIGWQQFRANIPFANPFEIIGFYSIHSFEPMALPLAVIASLVVVLIIALGFLRIKNKLYWFSIFFVFAFFLIWYGVIYQNFWAYNRVITYTLFFPLVLFTVGLTEILDRVRDNFVKVIVIAVVLVTAFFSAVKLNQRMINEHLSVDKRLVSLTELNNNPKIVSPILTSDTIIDETRIWERIWTEYFLQDKLIVSSANLIGNEQLVTDGTLVLVPKTSLVKGENKILTSTTVWENEYWRLGPLCASDDCLSD